MICGSDYYELGGWMGRRATMARITGVGGVFFKSKGDSAALEVIQGPESHENGKFAWIMDPDENKVELWEPKVWDDKNKGA
jgi:hypothetical protein